ncbi:MAG: dehydrogenase, partial [Saprospiraceae bacterium]|nr:dehydrogenase [Saprospiraceae bacterium]
MANIHEHAVLTDVLTPDGSGYVGSHGEDFLLANNAQWIGFSLEIGPDGGLYVLDWHDADICGKEVVNKETGRVFRIMPRQNHAKQWIDRNIDLSQLSDLDLAKLQSSESNWHTRRARLIMQERSQQKSLEPEATKYLSDLLYQNQPDAHRLNALWSLYCINMLTENDWHKLLSDKNEFIRAWTIQLLSEDEAPANELLSKIETMAKNEPSPVVRLYLASMLQRLPLQSRWNCFESLAKFAVDTADHNIPLMLWYAFEPMVNADPQQALSAIAQSPFIQLRKFTARRLIDGGHIEDLINHLSLKDNQITDLLEGMLTALEDRTDIKEPPSWKQKVESLQTSNKGINTLLRNIDQQFGTQETIRTLLSTLENNNATVPDLQNAINQLAARREKDLIKFLPHLLENSNLQREVIQAIAQYDDRQLGELLLSKYAGFPHQVKSEVIQTLSSRSLYGGQLAMAIADGRIPKKEIPAYIARQLRRVVGSGFVEIWGPIDEPDPDIQQSYIKYKNLLQRAAADKIDYAQGALVFQTSCGPCHTMYGKGGHIGPELTGSNRTNIDYLLANILEPNAEIQDDYRMFVVTTHDGRIFTGNKISE